MQKKNSLCISKGGVTRITRTDTLYRSTEMCMDGPSLQGISGQGISGEHGMVGANCLRVFGLRSALWPMTLMDDPRAGSRLRQRA